MDRQKLFDDAQERFAREINVHTVLSTVRMTEFMASLMRLQVHHRILVNKQLKY